MTPCPHDYVGDHCAFCQIAELKAKLATAESSVEICEHHLTQTLSDRDAINLKLLAATVENEKLRAFALSVIDEYRWVERPAIFLEAKRREAEEVLKASHVSTLAAEQLREALRAGVLDAAEATNPGKDFVAVPRIWFENLKVSHAHPSVKKFLG